VRLDPIVIVPYDSEWPESFERARRVIAPGLQPWTVRDIEHIGSTAVPGLAAKPIIDMLAVVVDVHEAFASIPDLTRRGWLHAPEPGDEADRMLSLCSPSVERRTHHLHVVEERSSDWRAWLAFRDYFRRHPGTAAEYAALKTDLARAHGHDPDDRAPYRDGKAEFVTRITACAQAAARAPESG
jgi:GrpB-like predicted nucleotidyltransferase (UPF0157 family)